MAVCRHCAAIARHPEIVQSLVLFRQAVDDVPRFGMTLRESPTSIASAAAVASQQYGLLSGDATIVAIMRYYGLANLASHDDDFDRVPWLTRYAPV